MEFAFYICGLIAILATLRVITHTNPVHALLYLIISLLAIISLQVWWVGGAIIVVAVPLFGLSIKSGKENYEAKREAGKYERIAEDYKKVLTGRDCADERTLFGYSDTMNERWFEKYETERKITLRAVLKNFVKKFQILQDFIE